MTRLTHRGLSSGICLGLGLLIVTSTWATEPPITALAFSPDAQMVVAASQAGVQVLDWPTATPRQTIQSVSPNLHGVVFSPGGKHLAVGGGDPTQRGVAEIFTWPACEPVAVLAEHSDSVLAIAWLDAARLLTASVDRTIKRWDLREPNASQHTFVGHSRSVTAVCLLDDDRTLVSGSVDHSLRVWDLDAATLVRSLDQHTRPVHALALRPAEGGLPLVASAAADRTIRFWQPTIGRMVRYVRLDSEPLSLAWLPDASRLAAACRDGQVRIVDATTVQVLQTLPGVDGWAYALAVHPTDGSLALGGPDGQVRRILLSR